MGICWLLYVRYSPVVSEGVYTSPGWMAGGCSGSSGRWERSVTMALPKFRTAPRMVTFSRVTVPVTPGARIRSPVMVMSWRQAPSAALTITVPSTSWV